VVVKNEGLVVERDEAGGVLSGDFTGDFVKFACPIRETGQEKGKTSRTQEWFLSSKKKAPKGDYGAKGQSVLIETSPRRGKKSLGLARVKRAIKATGSTSLWRILQIARRAEA